MLRNTKPTESVTKTRGCVSLPQVCRRRRGLWQCVIHNEHQKSRTSVGHSLNISVPHSGLKTGPRCSVTSPADSYWFNKQGVWGEGQMTNPDPPAHISWHGLDFSHLCPLSLAAEQGINTWMEVYTAHCLAALLLLLTHSLSEFPTVSCVSSDSGG